MDSDSDFDFESDQEIFPGQDNIGFKTFIFIDKDFGKVPLSFAKSLMSYLGDLWYVRDEIGNKHRLKYNENPQCPLLTDGWAAIRKTYDLHKNHAVWFHMVGLSAFEITVSNKPISLTTILSNEARFGHDPPLYSFKVFLTDYKASASQLYLPGEFNLLLRKKGKTQLYLKHTSGIGKWCNLMTTCAVRIGKGWREFCQSCGFQASDTLLFDIPDEDISIVYVCKVL